MASTLEIATIISVAGVALYLIRSYMQGGTCRSQVKLQGKTVVITGGNTGIGKETAIDLAKRGARIILACRNQSKGNDAVIDIIQASGSSNVVLRLLDLGSFKSIRDFAAEVNKNEDRVDILINNAGVMFCPYMETQDGYETQFGTNHLGHFLLTNLLLDKIKACAPSRIVNVSSHGHFYGEIDFDDLLGKKKYDSYKAYFQSKLANVLFTRQLAKRLQGTGVTTNSLHPGAVNTELARHLSLSKVNILSALVAPVFWVFLKTPRQGAQTSIYCAIDTSLNDVSGQYFADCRQMKCAKRGYDDGVAKKLWEVSEELTGLANNN